MSSGIFTKKQIGDGYLFGRSEISNLILEKSKQIDSRVLLTVRTELVLEKYFSISRKILFRKK